MTYFFDDYEKVLDAISEYIEKYGKVNDDFMVDTGVVLPIWAKSFADYLYQKVHNELSKEIFCDYRNVSQSNVGYLYKGQYYAFTRSWKGCETTIIKANQDKPPMVFLPIGECDWTGENELIQYIIVNKDLEMSPGKIAAQVGHACTDCAFVEKGRTLFNLWYMNCQKKIILGAHEKDIRKIMDLGIGYHINDLGLTEIPPNSLTCLSLGVMTRKMAEKYVKRLQVLK